MMHLGEARLRPMARGLGSAALIVTAVVHAWLYFHAGYRHIPTIGPSFGAVVITAVVLALLVAGHGGAFLGVVSAGFLLSVFGGYLLSATVGLFGFTETGQTTAAVICGLAELGGAVALSLGVLRIWALPVDSPLGSSSRATTVANKRT